MGYVRIEVLDDFKGETVVLLAMDTAGLNDFESVLSSVGRDVAVPVPQNLQNHEFLEEGLDEIEFSGDRVKWHLSPAKKTEILEKLQAMKKSRGACHHYVDINGPTKTLVLSRDEYIRRVT